MPIRELRSIIFSPRNRWCHRDRTNYNRKRTSALAHRKVGDRASWRTSIGGWPWSGRVWAVEVAPATTTLHFSTNKAASKSTTQFSRPSSIRPKPLKKFSSWTAAKNHHSCHLQRHKWKSNFKTALSMQTILDNSLMSRFNYSKDCHTPLRSHRFWWSSSVKRKSMIKSQTKRRKLLNQKSKSSKELLHKMWTQIQLKQADKKLQQQGDHSRM